MKIMETLLSQHPQWASVLEVCRTLHSKGHEAVLAGGCVRDALLGKLAKDIDIATSATPEQIENIFPRVLMVGKAFGVCRVVLQEGLEPVELATYREESDYKDGRHPLRVVFSNMKKDSARRDFTVNAMFYDLEKKILVDYVKGQEDLANRILRTVGDPEERFSEDSLRLLRAARFAAQLQFNVEPATLTAIQKLASQLRRVSAERRHDEIHKAFSIEKPFLFFKHLKQMHLQPVLFEDMQWDEEPLQSFFQAPCPANWGWAALVFLEKQKKESQTVQRLSAFKLSKETLSFIETALAVLVFLKGSFSPSEKALETFVTLMQKSQIEDVMKFLKRYLAAIGLIELLRPWEALQLKYAPQGLPRPLVVGQDLLMAGFKPGPELGQKLQLAYLRQLQNPQETREQILSRI